MGVVLILKNQTEIKNVTLTSFTRDLRVQQALAPEPELEIASQCSWGSDGQIPSGLDESPGWIGDAKATACDESMELDPLRVCLAALGGDEPAAFAV